MDDPKVSSYFSTFGKRITSFLHLRDSRTDNLRNNARIHSRDGQSLIETCLAVGLICLLFMGILQVSQVFAGKEILQHAAACGARTKTVGFNWWMTLKSVRTAAIPNCGNMLEPDIEAGDIALNQMMSEKPGIFWDWALNQTPASEKFALEIARIPNYLNSPDEAQARYVLNYDGWENDSLRISVSGFTADQDQGMLIPDDPDVASTVIDFGVNQTYPLWVPLHETFYGAESIELSGQSSIENHYSHYLENTGSEE